MNRVHVFATSLLETRAALSTASKLADGLGATLQILVPEVVYYGAPADASIINQAGVIDVYRRMASQMGIDADVQLCLCRRESDVYRMLLPEQSTVVIGGRRRSFPWPNAIERAVQTLESLGHRVLVVEHA
jgi:hypothetical protein